MKKIYFVIIPVILFISSVTYSCKDLAPGIDPSKCAHATDGLILKKWGSMFIQTDTYNSSGTLTGTSYDHPTGFLKFSGDGTYTVVSDGLSVKGNWLFDANCKLALTVGGDKGITFEVVALTSDSLVIRKKVGNLVVTQHFCGFSCNYQPYLVKKWENTITQVDNYNSDGTVVVSTNYLKPVGFFELNSDSTYRVLSNRVPLNGTWSMNADLCDITLDKGGSLQRTFEIVKATADSLVIRRKDGNIAYTQHYKASTCATLTQLQQTWDNVDIRTDFIFNGGVTNTAYDYPYGYFKLNADATYNVYSNGIPLDGKWELFDQSHGCLLDLDKGTSIDRSFDVLKVSVDSLIIWRADFVNGKAYTQKYKKH